MQKNKLTLKTQYLALKKQKISPDEFMVTIIEEWERIENTFKRYFRFVLKKWQYVGQKTLLEDDVQKTALLLTLKELIANDKLIIRED
jgi:hypothetical protein